MGILTLRSSVAAGGGGGEDNDGLAVSDYANFDPDAAQIISLDVNSTLPNWGTNGGSSISFAEETWWNGSSVPVATMFPPTSNDAGWGLGQFLLWKNATKEIRQLNIRWEYMVSDAFCANTVNHPKFIIVNSYTQLQSVPTVPPDRPMLFIENMQESGEPGVNIDDALFLCVSQGTTRMFSSTNLVPGPTGADWVDGGLTGPASYCSMPQPFYHRATSGTDGSGNPILAASEIVTLEMRINVMSTTDEPDGIIAYRVYRRSGQHFERGCAWTWESEKTVDANYIALVDNMGGGYNNVGNPFSAGLWAKAGRRLTFGFNLSPTVGRHWIGPPTGFVT